MTLYINDGEHPTVYRSKRKLTEPNQDYTKFDRLSEWMEEQQKVNRSLKRSNSFLNQLYERQDHIQTQMDTQVKELVAKQHSQDQFKQDVLERLRMLDNKSSQLEEWLKSEEHAREDLIYQVKSINESNKEIINKITDQKVSNDELIDQLNQIVNAHEEMSEQLMYFDQNQQEMSEQVQRQEALMEKLNRQMLNFRSILYERSHHLAEKIEDQHEMTSSYVHQLMTGSDKPLTMVMTKKEQEKDQKDSM
ncbi:chromosome segregation ATPase [Alkalibacillus filiformis]|uniref:Chromosome segregation ATPase n=1 Tax=Alkalibacillus filiformis TaxID=200990 RepID=A0ABU0DSP6_9BACI|nr:hypothetical protein [Alkalibacillus filiformis]MDQ0351457.1 chromosome segregation ATPase [Alkalibacillus filiformis]